MKYEVREDSVIITGYINACERLSKPIREPLHGKIRTFLERVKAGVFRTALKRNDDVQVLLNHNKDRVLAGTKDGTAKLEEDNIGLRGEITITDPEVVEKARAGKLVGWSFGFYPNSDELSQEGQNEIRTLLDIDLREVSILDDTKSPAYYGTSIETRAEDDKQLELRESSFENNEFEEDELVDKITKRVLENLREQEKVEEEPKVEEPITEEVVEKPTEKIDYSIYEDRIKALN